MLHKRLDTFLVLYLIAPLALFLGYSFKPIVAFGLLLLFALSATPLVLSTLRTATAGSAQWSTLAWVIPLTVVWVLLSGAGNHFYSNYDWQKHDAVLSDLTQYPWPVTYLREAIDGSSIMLRYYEAIYLPPAMLGKVFGHASQWMMAWIMLGVFLVLTKFVATVRRGPTRLVLAAAFIGFGGMDVVGWLILHGREGLSWDNHIEHWTLLSYQNSTTILFWVPQHALSAWIATSLLVDRDRDPLFILGLPALMIATLFWSPFVVIGLLPLMVVPVARWIREQLQQGNLSRFSKSGVLLAAGALVASGIVGAMLAAFLTAGSEEVASGWIWDFYPVADLLRYVPLFLLIELFVIVACMLWARVKFTAREWIAIGFLTLLPVYVIGVFNDLVMRASIPALFVLLLAIRTRFASEDRFPSKRWLPLALVLVIGVGTAVPEVVRDVRLDAKRWEFPGASDVMTFVGSPPYQFSAQYLANQPEWMQQLLREQAPVLHPASIAGAGAGSGSWQVNTCDTCIGADARVRVTADSVVMTVGADGAGRVSQIEALSPGLYRLRATLHVPDARQNNKVVVGVADYSDFLVIAKPQREHFIDVYLRAESYAPLRLTIGASGLVAGSTVSLDGVILQRLENHVD